MIQAIQTAALGMERASKVVESVPANLSRGDAAEGKDIPGQMVNLIVASRVYDANAKVIETAQRMLDIVV